MARVSVRHRCYAAVEDGRCQFNKRVQKRVGNVVEVDVWMECGGEAEKRGEEPYFQWRSKLQVFSMSEARGSTRGWILLFPLYLCAFGYVWVSVWAQKRDTADRDIPHRRACMMTMEKTSVYIGSLGWTSPVHLVEMTQSAVSEGDEGHPMAGRAFHQHPRLD